MKAILCLPLLFAAFAYADEVADRAAIARAIDALNEIPSRIADVTESPAAARETMAVLMAAPPPRDSARPSVTISHEPWGEATLNFPAVEPVGYRVVAGAMRFLTPDVALVDAYTTRTDATFLHRPILFVMKKVGNDWKIASARLLALH